MAAAAGAPATPSWGCARSVDEFEKLEQIGEGTYGQVYMAKNKTTGEIVALKKVRMDNEKEGFPITAIREIKILKNLAHKNVVKLKEIVVSRAHAANQNKGSIYMVFEYLDHDLTGLADRPGVKFTPGQIKFYMQQLLSGLHYCHKNSILHRDIKGSNILINNDGVVKIADFGLARSATQESASMLTNRVITLWYRPPELLLGATKYGPEVDLWSVGCIFAELVTGKPILPGKNESEQLDLIFRLCGAPSEEIWPGCTKLPWFQMFKPDRPHRRRLLEFLKSSPADVQDLCDKLLNLDPSKRITAEGALLHDYFFNEPKPSEPGELQRYEASHEFQTKKRRQEARAKAEADAAAKRAHTEAAVVAAGGAPRVPGPPHPHGMHPHAGGSMPLHPYQAPFGGMPHAYGGAGSMGLGAPPPGAGFPRQPPPPQGGMPPRGMPPTQPHQPPRQQQPPPGRGYPPSSQQQQR